MGDLNCVPMINLARAGQPDVLLRKPDLSPFEKVTSLTADREHGDVLAVAVSEKGLGRLNNIGIECSGEPFVRTDQDHHIFAVPTFVEQGMRYLARNA